MVNDRFIRLLTKDLTSQLNEDEQEELKNLLQNNKEYREQSEILRDYWKRDKVAYAANTAMFKKVLEKIRAEENNIPDAIAYEPVEETPSRRISLATWYRVAAVVLVAAGIFLYQVLHRSPVIPAAKPANELLAMKWLQKNTLPTKKSVITLSDGTVVTLNSATTLKYPDRFEDQSREVYLDGEAYFDVAKDASHPFIIHTNKMNIRVLGTDFNVKSYQNELLSEATLIRGSIEVTLNDRPSDRIILKPKEKLIVQNNNSIKKQSIVADSSVQESTGKGTRYSLTNLTYFRNNAKTVVETSWVENKLVFSDKDFSQLSGQLERWYGVHIEFANDRVKEYRFTALFDKETLPEALDALKMTEQFRYKIDHSTVYIY